MPILQLIRVANLINLSLGLYGYKIDSYITLTQQAPQRKLIELKLSLFISILSSVTFEQEHYNV